MVLLYTHTLKERKKIMLGKIFKGFGAVALMMGIMVAAGSAGDCDGACGPGNDLATMLMLAGTGVILMLGGAFCILAGTQFDAE